MFESKSKQQVDNTSNNEKILFISNEIRLKFIESYKDLNGAISILKRTSTKEIGYQLLNATTKSNQSNIFHFILQEKQLSEALIENLLLFLNYVDETFGSNAVRESLLKKNIQNLSPLDKWVQLHKPSLIISIDPIIMKISELNKRIKNIDEYTEENSESIKLKMLETQNEVIKQKSDLLRKLQQKEPNDKLALNYLNLLFQFAFRIKLVFRINLCITFRLMNNIDKNKVLNKFFINHDKILNQKYKNRIKALIGHLEESDEIEEHLLVNHTKLLAKLEKQQDINTFTSYITGKSSFKSDLQHLFESNYIDSETKIDQFLSLIQEKKFAELVWIPTPGDIVVYRNYDSQMKHLSVIKTILDESNNFNSNLNGQKLERSDIMVESFWEGSIVTHPLHITPNNLWQDILIYRVDKKQIQLMMQRQEERKEREKQEELKSSKHKIPQGMTEKEERKLNNTIEQLNRLLNEAQ